ncbi:hypothetical protein Rhopal_001993-T1 [Rhodotorula paludigena]|uniref:Ubiquitin-like domain-containing protein n=1 Tax=Rhodotorula paludigena TaxID=86838 RepID=A0AAV5GH04_9BASI|nr:hypothetical protein Rhopal_001993-T1 [Rhodotorula paludigena]
MHRQNTVNNVKAKIEGKEGVLPNQQRLILGGKQLSNGRLLVDYDVQNGLMIHLMGQIRGSNNVEVHVKDMVKASDAPTAKYLDCLKQATDRVQELADFKKLNPDFLQAKQLPKDVQDATDVLIILRDLTSCLQTRIMPDIFVFTHYIPPRIAACLVLTLLEPVAMPLARAACTRQEASTVVPEGDRSGYISQASEGCSTLEATMIGVARGCKTFEHIFELYPTSQLRRMLLRFTMLNRKCALEDHAVGFGDNVERQRQRQRGCKGRLATALEIKNGLMPAAFYAGREKAAALMSLSLLSCPKWPADRGHTGLPGRRIKLGATIFRKTGSKAEALEGVCFPAPAEDNVAKAKKGATGIAGGSISVCICGQPKYLITIAFLLPDDQPELQAFRYTIDEDDKYNAKSCVVLKQLFKHLQRIGACTKTWFDAAVGKEDNTDDEDVAKNFDNTVAQDGR